MRFVINKPGSQINNYGLLLFVFRFYCVTSKFMGTKRRRYLLTLRCNSMSCCFMLQVNIMQSLLMKLSLREYQLIGIDWMTSVCQTATGCILADESGLGKKVQTIGFLAHLAAERGVWGPHLVIVPTLYILTWEMEFERCFPACRAFVYYGDANARRKLRKVFYFCDCEYIFPTC